MKKENHKDNLKFLLFKIDFNEYYQGQNLKLNFENNKYGLQIGP